MDAAPAPTPEQLLDLAGRFYKHAGAREQAIRDELNLSATAFWQQVVKLVTAPPPDVAVRFPQEIARLRRRVEAGHRQRAPRRVA